MLHRDGVTHRPFHTQTLAHTDTFTHRRFYTQNLLDPYLLHTDVFYSHWLNLLYINSFIHGRFYTQTLSHIDLFTQMHHHSLSKNRHKETSPHWRTHTHIESHVDVDVDFHLSITSQSASNVVDRNRYILTNYTNIPWRIMSFLRQRLILHRKLRCSHADDDARDHGHILRGTIFCD